MNYKLVLIDSATGSDQTQWVLPPPITIGRSPTANVSIGDPSISRRHCQLTLDSQGALIVRDLESMNGTYVDDSRVTKAVLKPGDIIRIGALTLRVEWTDESAIESSPFGTACDAGITQPMRTISKADADRIRSNRSGGS